MANFVEKLLALLLIIGVLGGVYIFFKEMGLEGETTYEQFKSFVSYILVLVIALELCEMLLNKKPGTVIEIFLLAITRKLLVYTNETYEFVFGSNSPCRGICY